MRSARLLVVVAIAATACSTVETTTQTSLVPLVDPGALPVSTPAPTTTLAPSSDPNSPLVAALPDTECGWADRLQAGEVTFVAGDRLYGAALDGTVIRCLATVAADQRGSVRWSPQGDRVLLTSAVVVDAAGKRASGFDPANTRTQWVYPDGAAIIGPTASNRTLVHRDAATAARTEITFLASTLAAVSHPAGGAIVASGTSGDGTAGIFVSLTDGSAPIPLLTVDDPDTEVVELGADAAGDAIYFIAQSPTSFRVFQLLLHDLVLTELSQEQAPILQLTTGPVPRAVAWKVGLCNSLTDTRVRDERSATAVTVGVGTPLEGLSVAPVGWLDAARLVVAARPLGCEGPADVWIWNILDGSATLLAKTVEFAAVRTANEPAVALSVSPAAQPPVL